MRRLTGISRMFILTAAACTLWFMRTPAVHAQLTPGECIKSFATEGPTASLCPDCCPKQPVVNNIVVGVFLTVHSVPQTRIVVVISAMGDIATPKYILE